jgi:hypothetical protein
MARGGKRPYPSNPPLEGLAASGWHTAATAMRQALEMQRAPTRARHWEKTMRRREFIALVGGKGGLCTHTAVIGRLLGKAISPQARRALPDLHQTNRARNGQNVSCDLAAQGGVQA